MTDATVVQTDVLDSAEAGAALGNQIATAFQGKSVDALIVFISPQHEYPPLLETLNDACKPRVMVGCSSAGEFSSGVQREGSACAIALHSSEMRFCAGLGHGLRTDRAAAAREVVASFQGITAHDYRYRSALVLTDALAGHADNLVEQLTGLTGGAYQFFGGGAGDDARFNRTHVFCGTEAATDAVVALEILSNKPLGIGVGHGWQPASPGMRVTEADGMRLASLNAAPAVEAFDEHAAATGQRFEPAEPLPFFLQNVLGIETGQGHKLRVPLTTNDDGSIVCAADIPEAATVHIMNATSTSAAEAAVRATQSALAQLGEHKPGVAFFFDCVATRLRTGKDFGVELQSLQAALGSAAFAGCNTYGQIARAEGQFSGFHNCTAVVCIIPE